MSELLNFTLIAQAGATATMQAANEGSGMMPNWLLAIIFLVVVFILPFVVGSFLAKSLRMATDGGRFGLALCTITAAVLICALAGFKLPLGVDMKGGTILTYDVIKSKEKLNDAVSAKDVVTALQNRLNPSGTKEISIRPYGENQIEVVVPNVDPFEVNQIKKLISDAGMLKFRILANTQDHADIIEAARGQARETKIAMLRTVYAADKHAFGEWYPIGRKDKLDKGYYPLRYGYSPRNIYRNARNGQLLEVPALSNDRLSFEKWLAKEKIDNIEILTAFERGGKPFELISGDDLASAGTRFDGKTGLPSVSFTLTTAGSTKMFAMTAMNQPVGDFHRQMAIILDEQVLSAPQLNSPISSSGEITGNFTRDEVEYMVRILRAGKLPAALSKQPTAENRIGSLLGVSAVQKGTYASILSLIGTFACIILYYRFSGIVAAIALALNGIMILATMILIQQPLTLPGLAGAVLTLGMAVDANVLVFERMREEVQKGSTTRMAIRNGFDRALTTITDSNLTTVISAVVLYWIGTDQIRGFAVSLIIGIVISMFTAVYCSRIMFDVAEKLRKCSLSMSDGLGWLKKTTMGERDIDFMAWQKFNVMVSLVLIVIGLVAVGYRGRQFLAIDFTGGTSATFLLKKPMEADELRKITESIFDKDENGERIESTLQRMEQEPLNTVFKIDTSLSRIEDLRKRLVDGLGQHKEVELVSFKAQVKLTPDPKATGWLTPAVGARLVAMQDPAAAPNPLRTEEAPAAQPPAADATPAAQPAAAPAADAKPATEAPAATPSVAAPAANQTPPQAEATVIPANPAEGVVPGSTAPAAAPPAPSVTSLISLALSKSSDSGDTTKDGDPARMSYQALMERVNGSAAAVGLNNVTEKTVIMRPVPMVDDWTPNSSAGFSTWEIEVPLDAATAQTLADQLQKDVEQEPVWLSLSNIGERVAGDMKEKAVAALLVSVLFIIAYIWFRFQKIAYGLAAVIALLHDVLITLGIVALCHWLAVPLGFLLIEDFKIDLIMVAAFLTIIGYSLNDTIVVFDRIREVRGKSPRLTSDMVNVSVNQTLSRTLLTSSTTLLTIALLYFFGGEGIHGFTFALFVGIVVGTYSSIFIASPVLLWLANRQQPSAAVVTTGRKLGSRPTA
ncbi:MAG: protein translocase subunit SecD [Pirellulales bacterium]